MVTPFMMCAHEVLAKTPRRRRRSLCVLPVWLVAHTTSAHDAEASPDIILRYGDPRRLDPRGQHDMAGAARLGYA